MKVIIYGANGRMGKELADIINGGYLSASIAAMIDRNFENEDEICKKAFPDEKIDADVIIDFSNHACIFDIADYATKYNIPVVVATTGHLDDEAKALEQLASAVPVFASANMSMGIALLIELAKKAVVAFPNADIEIIEKHHSKKIDSPSGTALMLVNALTKIRENAVLAFGRNGRHAREKNEIGIHAIRAGSIVGEHEVIIATESEIITLKHEAKSRAVFAEGSLMAANWLMNVKKGFYTMQDIIDN